jgi:hypothetical protein
MWTKETQQWKERHFVGNKTEIFLRVLENTVSVVSSKTLKIISCQMQTFPFFLLIVCLKAPVLLREVICDVFLHWLSWELAAVAVIVLYLCQACMCVILLSREAGSMQDSANQISL